MNLANTFARVRKLFAVKPTKTIRLIDVNEHLQRDIGLYNINSDRRVLEHTARTEILVAYGVPTRAP